MSYSIQKLIDVALDEVGYLEKGSKTNLDSKTGNAGSLNYTKYARDLAAISYFNGNKQGVAWCATFVAWCFVQAFGKQDALKLLCQPVKAANNCGAGCKYARNYFASKGQLNDAPKIGDVIFFYSSDKSQIAHTGLVYKVDSKKVYTVEGNTSGTSGVVANGGGVWKKSYSLGYKRIAGYGRPEYGSRVIQNPLETVSDAQSIKYTLHTVGRGETLWNIAKKHLGKGSRYGEIKTLNGLKSDTIKVGQVLKIPKA